MSIRTILIAATLLAIPGAAAAQRRTSWSPDGRHLVVPGKGHDGIYVVRADGSDSRKLYASGGWDADPSWSRDGTRIAFASGASWRDLHIYVMDADGTNLRQLTDGESSDAYPSWSPDGATLAFNSLRTGSAQIFLMRSDGSAVRQVTHTSTNEWNPGWSPDGRRLVFESNRNGHGQDDIFVIDTTGANEHAVMETLVNEIYPSWDPDGSRLAICTVANRKATIEMLGLDGAVMSRDVAEGCLPSWSPDGARIAFQRQGGDDSGIFVLTLSDGHIQRITR